MNLRLSKKTNELVQDILKFTDGSEIQKLLYLHNFILSSVEYPNIKIIRMGKIAFPIINIFNKTHRNFGTSYGVLINKKAYCFGIAKFVKYICGHPKINIKCELVNAHCFSPIRGRVVHMWNIVYIGGQAYHLDSTFDIVRNENSIKKFKAKTIEETTHEIPGAKATKFSDVRFLVSDKAFETDHIWNKGEYPKCDNVYPKNIIKQNVDHLSLNKVNFIYS